MDQQLMPIARVSKVYCHMTCGKWEFKFATNYKCHVWQNETFILSHDNVTRWTFTNIFCHMVWQTTLLSSLRQLLEKYAFCRHTHSKTLTPLGCCVASSSPCWEQASLGLWGSAGLKMSIHAHFFGRWFWPEQ